MLIIRTARGFIYFVYGSKRAISTNFGDNPQTVPPLFLRKIKAYLL